MSTQPTDYEILELNEKIDQGQATTQEIEEIKLKIKPQTLQEKISQTLAKNLKKPNLQDTQLYW